MYGISPLILIFLPLFFQLICGKKAIGETIPIKFGTVVLISILLQIVVSIISFNIAAYNFTESLHGEPYRCGMGLLGIYFLDLLSITILVVIIIAQYFIKKSYEKN